ncbi:sporulation protein [Haloarcula sp. S1CR25-12]|uniref:Sporulation protein n=1 Tax=Haloarcula saliterrae TaxID=2950534 RepID=A0ABU2FF14_9EURY|nr:sporulation protein [Haloarcula sp. S1CR25-12]MDS0260849.1 sporulation protein [Haloarcula sp. S1CR25-12]
MKRVLSSIGVGAATVDTVFPRTELVPGETVTAEVELYGGDATQEIDGIYFDLKTRLSEGEDEERLITEFALDEEIELSPGDERTVPVDIEIPPWVPLTRGGASVWLETGLDIDWAVDPTDEDRIDIVPDAYIQALFDALEELGFALRYAELVETPYLDDRPFAQEFDFRPTDSRFTDDLDELEVTIVPRSDDLRVFVEFDTVDEVAEEYDMDFDEMEASLTFDRADAEMIRRRMKNEIKQHT